MSEMYDGPNRRSSEDGTVIDMIREQIAATNKALTDHVMGCTKSQKWTIILVAVTLLWLVCHSPEAAKLVAKAFPSFPVVGG